METAVSGRTWDFQIVILKSALPKQDVEKHIVSPPAVFDHTNPNRELSYFNNKTLRLQSEEASQSRLGPEPDLLTAPD